MKKDLIVEKAFDEVYLLESILKITKDACAVRELYTLKSEYNNNNRLAISEERNDYMNMLAIALERISKIKNYNTVIEKDLYTLQQNTNNCSRKITTKCTAYKRP